MDYHDNNRPGILLFVSWSVVLVLFVTIVDYNGLYGQDSHEYLRYAIGIQNFFRSGVLPEEFFWPVNYSLAGALLGFITGPQAALQLLSIVSSAWIIYMLYQVLVMEFPGREREILIYVVLFLGCSPYIFRYAISAMSDMFALAFAVNCYYLLYLSRHRKNSNYLYLVLVLASVSVFSRLAMIPLVAPAVVYGIYAIIRNFKPVRFFISLLAASVFPLVFLYFKQDDPGLIFNHFLVAEWSVLNYFKNSFHTIDGFTQYLVPNIIYVFSFMIHPGFLYPGILFLVLFFVKRHQPAIIFTIAIAAVLLYGLFIAGLPSRNTRFLIPFMPFYLLMCFPAYMTVLSWLYNRRTNNLIAMVSAILLQGILLVRAFHPFLNYNRTEKHIAEKLKELHAPVIYTFGIDGALRSYHVQSEIINLWYEPLHEIKPGAVLVFNKSANEIQWKDRNPMLNYFLIVDSAKAVKTEVLENGWEIYEIKEAYPPAHTGVSRIE